MAAALSSEERWPWRAETSDGCFKGRGVGAQAQDRPGEREKAKYWMCGERRSVLAVLSPVD